MKRTVQSSCFPDRARIRGSVFAGAILLALSMICLPSRAELISYWNFDDGESANDSAGLNHGIEFKNFNGAPTHSVDTPPGGGAFSLDLSHGQDYVTLPPPTNGITREFTIAMWVKYSAYGRSVFSIKRDLTGGGGDRSGIGLGIQDGFAYLGIISSAGDDSANNGATFHDIRTATAVPANEWVHLAATVKDDKATIYINGVPETQYSGAGESDGTLKVLNAGIDFNDANGSFTGFGADGSAPNPAADSAGDFTTAFYDGLIDEVGIWSVALEAAEIESLAQGGSISDVLTLTLSVSEPANNAHFLPANAVIRFVAESSDGIENSGIQLILNGEDRSSELVISGNATGERTATFSGLEANEEYEAVIRVTDLAGKERSQTIRFNTYSSGTIFVEAEDYDFEGGQYLNAPGLSSFPAPDNYLDRIGVPGVDHHILGEGNENPYRIGDTPGVGFADDFPLRQNFLDAQAIDPGVEDYALDALRDGEWLNYTRDFPSGHFRVFCRVASTGGVNLELGAVPAGAGGQDPVYLGSFSTSGTGGATSYSLVPLADANGNPLIISLGGKQTLRLTAISGASGSRVNYLFFVPAEVAGAAAVALAEPVDGSIGVASDAAVHAVIVNQGTQADPSTVRLSVNGQDVTSSAAVTSTPQGISLSYSPAGGWEEGSVQNIELSFSDDATPPNSVVHAWSFHVRRPPSGNTPEIFADAVLRVTFEGNSAVDISGGLVSQPIVEQNISYTTDLPPMANRTGVAAVFNGVDSFLSYGLGEADELAIRSNLTYHARVRFEPTAFAAGRPEQWILGRFRSPDQGTATRVTAMSVWPVAAGDTTARIFGGVSADGGSWAVGLPEVAEAGPGEFYDVTLRFEPGVAVWFDVFSAETGLRVGPAHRLETTVTELLDANTPLDIGNRTTPSNTPLAGDIEQINVWNRTLSDAEVYAITHGELPPIGTITLHALRVASPGQLELTFEAGGAGGNFQVEQSDAVAPAAWTPVEGALFTTGDGGENRATFAAPASAPKFYRIRQN